MSEKPNDVQVEELVDLYNGESAPKSECSQFTIGCHADEWYHCDDTDIFITSNGDICHAEDDNDNINYTLCGDSFHNDEMDDLDIRWSQHDDCYAYERDFEFGYVYRNHEDWFVLDRNSDYIYCDGVYYVDSDVAAYHSIYYYDSVGEYRHVDDAPDEDDEDYTPYNVYDDPNNTNYLHTYHTNPDRRWRTDRDTAWTMGFEVEKEDLDARTSCYANALPHFWTKEHDGSLCQETGYELISPVYDLFGTLHEEDVDGSDLLLQHINGNHSSRCGGHIHIGSKNHTVEQIFEGISGFLPMLYSIYEKRTTSRYCEAKKKHEYLRRDKFSAVYVRRNTLEFRIFPAVKSWDNLKWRIGLLRIIVNNFGATERDVLAMMCDSNSDLHKHLANAVGNDKMMSKVSMFVNYSSLFNDTDLSDENQDIK